MARLFWRCSSPRKSYIPLPANAGTTRIGCMKTIFEAGDLVKFKENSWWLKRSGGFRNLGEKYSPDSLILVTDDLVKSERFFYGIVCGGDKEAHLWTHEEFELVSGASG